MFTLIPQDKKIAENILIIPFKSLGTLWFLILCVVTWMIQDFFCFVMVVHDSLVCSEQLNWTLFFRKILHVLRSTQLSSIFTYLNPFQQWLCDFEIHLFTLKIIERIKLLRNSTIKKGSNIHWCSRRKHDALRAGGGGWVQGKLQIKVNCT